MSVKNSGLVHSWHQW